MGSASGVIYVNDEGYTHFMAAAAIYGLSDGHDHRHNGYICEIMDTDRTQSRSAHALPARYNSIQFVSLTYTSFVVSG